MLSSYYEIRNNFRVQWSVHVNHMEHKNPHD